MWLRMQTSQSKVAGKLMRVFEASKWYTEYTACLVVGHVPREGCWYDSGRFSTVDVDVLLVFSFLRHDCGGETLGLRTWDSGWHVDFGMGEVVMGLL